jgi:hypothetical protein
MRGNPNHASRRNSRESQTVGQMRRYTGQRKYLCRRKSVEPRRRGDGREDGSRDRGNLEWMRTQNVAVPFAPPPTFQRTVNLTITRWKIVEARIKRYSALVSIYFNALLVPYVLSRHRHWFVAGPLMKRKRVPRKGHHCALSQHPVFLRMFSVLVLRQININYLC